MPTSLQSRHRMGPGNCGVCLRILLLSLLVVATAAQHTWLPLHSTGAGSSQPNSRQLHAVSTKLRLRDRRGGHQSAPSSCRDGSDRETRLPILVIGLKHRWQDRLANFLLKLRWYEDLYVVEAVDGRTIDPVGTMTSGEVACFESHRKAWARIVEEDWRQAVVMEDDAEVDLSENMHRVAQFVADAPHDWNMLYLGINNEQDIRVSNFSSTVAEPSTYILGTHAYVLRNNVAARLHALSETPPYKDQYLPVDIFLTQQGMKIYIINPPLVKQRNFGDTDTQGIRVKTREPPTDDAEAPSPVGST